MMTKEQIENKAAQLVSARVTAYKDALAFVTDKVAFNMRNVIKLARKNYWGIFDEQVDPVTGKKKVFVPLTQFITETVVKNIDLDTKDVDFRSKNENAIPFTSLVRAVVRNYLDQMHFGEKLDIFERSLATDGTAVWKTIQKIEDDGDAQDECEIKLVDLLNCYIDPQAESIQTSDFIERAVLTKEEIDTYEDWINKDKINYRDHIHPTDQDLTSFANKALGAEVFEFWGTITKDLITGNEEDAKTLLQGRIVTSRSGGSWQVHLIEENTEEKPYEEAWAIKVPGRWYGRGMPETIMQLQTWLNQVVNMRINKAQVAQLGIFKIRTGAGITPAMIARMASNGVIPVQQMDDIQQMPIEDVKSSSYNDESMIMNWAQRATSTYEAATGEGLPSSTPATNAAIQNAAVQSAFVLMKENLGFFLERWITHSLYPLIRKQLTANSIVRITGDLEDLRKLDELIASHYLYEEAEKYHKAGLFIDIETFKLEQLRILAKLKNRGKDRFIEVLKTIDPFEYDVKVKITNEEIDPTVITKNLLTMLQFVPEHKTQIVKQIADVMGIDLDLDQKDQLPMINGAQGQGLIPGQPANPRMETMDETAGQPGAMQLPRMMQQFQ